jgi:hypothetical protein
MVFITEETVAKVEPIGFGTPEVGG